MLVLKILTEVKFHFLYFQMDRPKLFEHYIRKKIAIAQAIGLIPTVKQASAESGQQIDTWSKRVAAIKWINVYNEAALRLQWDACTDATIAPDEHKYRARKADDATEILQKGILIQAATQQAFSWWSSSSAFGISAGQALKSSYYLTDNQSQASNIQQQHPISNAVEWILRPLLAE